MKHVISLLELTPDDIREIFRTAAEIKREFLSGTRPALLEQKVLTQVFEKPSLRTRVSFEAAMMQLGGSSIFLSGKDAGLHGRESLADVARVISGYSDFVVLRTFSQKLIEEFADHSSCPVINGLSDDRHPCQALTDLFTMQEVFGDLKGRRLVYLGDGNNVAASLATIGAQLGVPVTICSPAGYELKNGLLAELSQRFPKSEVTTTSDVKAAVKTADVIYTDVWASMGQEAEAAERNRVFAPYQVNAALLAAAPKACRFMHCLPARRGTEVTDEVMDGAQSIAFQQAENRMHLAKGLLVWLQNV